MYSTARGLSVISIILSVVNALATAMFFFYFSAEELGFAMTFTCSMYLITSTVVSLFLSIALRSLCKDLNFESEAKATQAHQLSKRIKELENKVNY